MLSMTSLRVFGMVMDMTTLIMVLIDQNMPAKLLLLSKMA